jgi:hypothetical protein
MPSRSKSRTEEDRVDESVNGQGQEHEGVYEPWIRSIGDVAAPLLAGFSFTAVIAISGETGHRRWPGLAILALTAAAVTLIVAVRSSYARDKSEVVAERWRRRTQSLYHLGVIELLLGLGFALAPPHTTGLQDALRWVASAIAFVAAASVIVGSWPRVRAAISRM